jgi:hypothetical protein
MFTINFQICGKGFVHKFYLTEHLDYHTGKFNYMVSVNLR